MALAVSEGKECHLTVSRLDDEGSSGKPSEVESVVHRRIGDIEKRLVICNVLDFGGVCHCGEVSELSVLSRTTDFVRKEEQPQQWWKSREHYKNGRPLVVRKRRSCGRGVRRNG